MYRGLFCLLGGCGAAGGRLAGGESGDGCGMTPTGVFVPEFGNKTLPGLPSAGPNEAIYPSFAGGVNTEGDETIGGGENCDENDVRGAGVMPNGWEGRSGL